MAVRVRLTRVGSKKNAVWRVVVADQRSPRDGRFIEAIGHYNPRTEPSRIALDEERLRYWLARGAQPTSTVKKLIRVHAAGAEATGNRPDGSSPSEPQAEQVAGGEAPADEPPVEAPPAAAPEGEAGAESAR